MAAKDCVLYVSKEEYQEKLTEVESLLTSLRSLLEDYQQAKDNVSKFLSGDDSRFESFKELVDVNIKGVKTSISDAIGAKNILTETIKGYEEFHNEGNKFIDNTKEHVVDVLKSKMVGGGDTILEELGMI